MRRLLAFALPAALLLARPRPPPRQGRHQREGLRRRRLPLDREARESCSQHGPPTAGPKAAEPFVRFEIRVGVPGHSELVEQTFLPRSGLVLFEDGAWCAPARAGRDARAGAARDAAPGERAARGRLRRARTAGRGRRRRGCAGAAGSRRRRRDGGLDAAGSRSRRASSRSARASRSRAAAAATGPASAAGAADQRAEPWPWNRSSSGGVPLRWCTAPTTTRRSSSAPARVTRLRSRASSSATRPRRFASPGCCAATPPTPRRRRRTRSSRRTARSAASAPAPRCGRGC